MNLEPRNVNLLPWKLKDEFLICSGVLIKICIEYIPVPFWKCSYFVMFCCYLQFSAPALWIQHRGLLMLNLETPRWLCPCEYVPNLFNSHVCLDVWLSLYLEMGFIFSLDLTGNGSSVHWQYFSAIFYFCFCGIRISQAIWDY